jgi:hypothetical protein
MPGPYRTMIPYGLSLHTSYPNSCHSGAVGEEASIYNYRLICSLGTQCRRGRRVEWRDLTGLAKSVWTTGRSVSFPGLFNRICRLRKSVLGACRVKVKISEELWCSLEMLWKELHFELLRNRKDEGAWGSYLPSSPLHSAARKKAGR